MPRVGEEIAGKYRLTKLIGRGGMGVVYEALHEDLGKTVAIKFLSADFGASRESTARFRREARAAAGTGHRSIIDIYDIGETDDGSIFLVMELLTGETLGTAIARRGTLPIPMAAYVAGQVLSALQAAHDAGIVHRDIKPDNVFLLKTGQELPEVKLLDFGAARVVDPASPEERLTKSGMVLGTPFYMAPEQARGEGDLDGRIDVWAVGVMLYECLTGEVPFRADNMLALINRILDAPIVAPRELDEELPEVLDAIVMKALERDRDKRYASAGEMLRDLLSFMDEAGSSRISLPTEQRRLPKTVAQSEVDADAPTREAPGSSEPEDSAAVERQSVSTTPVDSESTTSRRSTWKLVAGGVIAIGAVLLLLRVGIPSGSDRASGNDLDTPRDPVISGAVDADVVVDASSSPVPITVDAAPSKAVPPDASTPTTVSITLHEVPDGALVFLDGERVAGTVVRVAPDAERSREVVVRGPRGREWRRTLRVEQSAEFLVELTRPSRGPAKRPIRTGRPTKTPPAGPGREPTPTKTPETPPAGEGSEPRPLEWTED